MQGAVVGGQADMVARCPLIAQGARPAAAGVAVLVGVVPPAVGGRVIGEVPAHDVEALAAGGAGGKAVVPALRGARQAQAGLDGFIGAVAHIRPGGQGTVLFALFGDDVDHAADGVRSVQAAGGAAQDLDAFDQSRVEGLQPGPARQQFRGAHAVDQHQRLAGIRAAQIDAADGLLPARCRELHARRPPNDFGDAVAACLGQLLRPDDGDVAHRVGQGFRAAAGGDDDVLQRRHGGVGGGGLGRGGQGKQTAGGRKAARGREADMTRPCVARVPARRYGKTPAGRDPPWMSGGCRWPRRAGQVSKQAGIGLARAGKGPGGRAPLRGQHSRARGRAVCFPFECVGAGGVAHTCFVAKYSTGPLRARVIPLPRIWSIVLARKASVSDAGEAG